MNHDLAAVGEFNGVADEVVKHLVEALRIADHLIGDVGVDAVVEFQPFAGRLGGEGVDHCLDDAGQIEFLGDARGLRLCFGGSALDLGAAGLLEQTGQQAHDGFGGTVQRFNMMTLWAAQRRLFQLLDALDHVGQWVLQHFGEADDDVG